MDLEQDGKQGKRSEQRSSRLQQGRKEWGGRDERVQEMEGWHARRVWLGQQGP